MTSIRTQLRQSPTTATGRVEPARTTPVSPSPTPAPPDAPVPAAVRPEAPRTDPRIDAALRQWRLKGGHTVPVAARDPALLAQAVRQGLVHDLDEVPDAAFADRTTALVLAEHFGSAALDRIANGHSDLKLVERALLADPLVALHPAVLKWRTPKDSEVVSVLQQRSDLADQVPVAARGRTAVAVAMVTADPGMLSSLPTRTRQAPAVVAAAVRNDPAVFDGADAAALRSHPEVVEALLLAEPSRWSSLDPALLTHAAVARAACTDPAFLSALPPRWASDRAFMLSIAEMPGALAAASPALRSDVEFVRTAVAAEPAAFALAAPTLRSNRAFVAELAQHTPAAIAHAARDLLDDDAFMRTLIECAPCCLSWASATLRDDTAVVRAAVARGADFTVSPRLSADPDTVLVALRTDALQLVPIAPQLLDDVAFALRAVAFAGARALSWFTDTVVNTPAVIDAAVADVSDARALDPRITLSDTHRLSLLTRNGWNADLLNQQQPLTRAEVLTAVANTGGVFPALDSAWQADVDVAVEAAVSRPVNLSLLDPAMLTDTLLQRVFARSPFALDAVPEARDRFLQTRPTEAAALAELRTRCARLGIEWPERFRSLAALHDMLAVREGVSRPDPRPVAVVMATKIDSNSAFLANGNFDRLTQGYQLHYYEVDTDKDAVRALRALRTRPAAAVILAGHGTQQFMSFGASDPARETPNPKHERLFFDFSDTDLVVELKERVAPGGHVILHSCSTGKGEAAEPNLANLVAQAVPHARVQAPIQPTNGQYTYDANGQLTGPGFMGGVGETYTIEPRS